MRKKDENNEKKYEPMKTMRKGDEKTRRTRMDSAFIFLICTLSKPFLMDCSVFKKFDQFFSPFCVEAIRGGTTA